MASAAGRQPCGPATLPCLGLAATPPRPGLLPTWPASLLFRIARLTHRAFSGGLRSLERLVDCALPSQGPGDGLADLSADPLKFRNGDELSALVRPRLLRLTVRIGDLDR